MWQDIPDYPSDRIESMRKKALEIIYPNISNNQALSLANEAALSNRRELLCCIFMTEMTDIIRELKQTMTATGTSPNKRFKEQNNS